MLAFLSTPTSNSHRRSIRRLSLITGLLFVVALLLTWYTDLPGRQRAYRPPLLKPVDKNGEAPEPNSKETSSLDTEETPKVAMVVASLMSEDTTWLRTAFVEWEKHIYVTDNPNADLTVPVNKGRESMVYLTYIIDNYERLPELIIFHHAYRYQWHNDDPLYDGQRVLSRLQLPYVLEQGYVNLRCVWVLGCPVEIHPFKEDEPIASHNETQPKDARAGAYFKEAFEELFPDLPVPEAVGLSCCAQFAATAQKIRERPKQDYERYRKWLLNTQLRDDLSGRLIEYFWHIILGQNAVYCPEAKECYCKVYGLCELECESKGICRSQYTLPKYSAMPKGWPDYDWNGNWQNASAM